MKTYKTVQNAIKALVNQVQSSDARTGTFICTLDDEPLKIHYSKGSKAGTIGLDFLLGNKHFLINNTYTNFLGEFQIFFDNLALEYHVYSDTVYLKSGKGEYLPITTHEIPKEDYLKICYYVSYYNR